MLAPGQCIILNAIPAEAIRAIKKPKDNTHLSDVFSSSLNLSAIIVGRKTKLNSAAPIIIKAAVHRKCKVLNMAPISMINAEPSPDIFTVVFIA